LPLLEIYLGDKTTAFLYTTVTMRRALVAGVVLWMIGTAMFRFGGHAMIHAPSLQRTIPVYLVYCLVSAIVVNVLLRLLRIPKESWPAATTLIILPTLLLDPFTTAFFSATFPNLPADAAPTFGGLMLINSAGAVLAGWIRR
jgi:hypothetical protein